MSKFIMCETHQNNATMNTIFIVHFFATEIRPTNLFREKMEKKRHTSQIDAGNVGYYGFSLLFQLLCDFSQFQDFKFQLVL